MQLRWAHRPKVYVPEEDVPALASIYLMIRAVIFDLDGTLVDSNELHVLAWQETFRHFGKEVPLERLRNRREIHARHAGAIHARPALAVTSP